MPGSTYHFTVTTVATDGQTSAAIALTAILPATVPSAPKIVKVVGLHHGLLVSWSAPKVTGGATIAAYRVTANCAGVLRTSHFAGTAHHGAITPLAAGTSCVVRVAATNRAGTGPPSAPAIGRPLA